MSSAIQLYSFPAQLGRRGTTMVVVVGLHVVMALGLIAGMTLRLPPPPPTWIPMNLPRVDPLPPRPHPVTDMVPRGAPDLALDPTPDPVPVRPEPDPVPASPGPMTDDGPIAARPPMIVSEVRLLRHDEPKYSAAEIRAGEHGSVAVRVLVGVDGRAVKVEVAATSGFARLDATALESVRHWLFAPAQTASGPVESWATYRVTFRLID